MISLMCFSRQLYVEQPSPKKKKVKKGQVAVIIFERKK